MAAAATLATLESTVRSNVTTQVVAGTSVRGLPELTAFRSALSTISETSRAARQAAWNAAYRHTASGPSLAYQLRKAIRDAVNAQADSTGGVSPLERESIYRTLVADFVPTVPQPQSEAQERTELEYLLSLDQLS